MVQTEQEKFYESLNGFFNSLWKYALFAIVFYLVSILLYNSYGHSASIWEILIVTVVVYFLGYLLILGLRKLKK